MANKTHYRVKAPGSETRLISGNFVCNTGSDPTTTSGVGWTVAAGAGTGQQVVTLTGGYPQILATTAGVQFGTVNVAKAEITAVDHNNSTFTITTTSGGSAFDFGSDVSCHFIATVRNTTVDDQS